MKIVGIEEHFLTSDIRRAWSASPLADQDAGLDLHLGEIEDRLNDLSEDRIRLMNESGVDMVAARALSSQGEPTTLSLPQWHVVPTALKGLLLYPHLLLTKRHVNSIEVCAISD
jgi:hypothetical protein